MPGYEGRDRRVRPYYTAQPAKRKTWLLAAICCIQIDLVLQLVLQQPSSYYGSTFSVP